MSLSFNLFQWFWVSYLNIKHQTFPIYFHTLSESMTALDTRVSIVSRVLPTGTIWLLHSKESEVVRFHTLTLSGTNFSMDDLAAFIRYFL